VQVPRNRGLNTTLLANMSLEGMGPGLAIEGATSVPIFEAYVEQTRPNLERRADRDYGQPQFP
jgi:hypothetical protein